MKRLQHSFKWLATNLSLKYKLLILLLTTSLLPIVIVSYSSQSFLYQSGTEYSGSISTQYAQFLSREISGYLHELDELLSPIYFKSEFQKYINTPKDDIEEQAQLAASFRPYIQNILETKNELQGVLYMDALGKTSYFSYKHHFNFLFSRENDPFYRTVPGYSHAELSSLHPANYTLGQPASVFSYIIPIVNFIEGKEITAWMAVEIEEDKIQSMLRQDDNELNSQLFLYNPTTKGVISDQQPGPLLAESIDGIIASTNEDQASLVHEIEGSDYQVTYHSLGSSDWKLVWIAPLDSINQGVLRAGQLTMLIAAVSLILSLFIAFPVMNKVMKPLFKLISSMRKVGRGAIEPIPMKPRNDELGFLLLSYNRMVNDLQTMEEEVYHAQIKEKERELLQLQAQINPHFLFNTLEAIDSYATGNNGKAVNAMVQSVSKMMRYSVRNDGGWAPIQEEIAYIHHFMNIHYYRHNQKVAVDIEIAPSCERIEIMKLSIQPFLENAIKHGWSPAMGADEFSLRVTIDRTGPTELQIGIHDSGSGIPEPILAKLNEMIANQGHSTDAFFGQHTGISNVCRRFYLAYGDNTTIRIQSRPGSGTSVHLSIPLAHS